MSAAEKKRVVITGIGVVAPNGVGVDAYEAALREGPSGPQSCEMSQIWQIYLCTFF